MDRFSRLVVGSLAVVGVSLAIVLVASGQTATWTSDIANNLVTGAGTNNVGIGQTITNPDRPLTIQAPAGGSSWVGLRDSNGNRKWHITGFGGGFDLAETGVADGRLFVQYGSGNVGIGLINPQAKLEISGGALKLASLSSDPVGIAGSMYYSSANGAFMCNVGGQWQRCFASTSLGGSGSGGYLAVFKDQVTLGTSSILDSGSNVQIGKPVSITGDITVSGGVNAGGASAPSCSSDQVLSGPQVRGGIVTGGTCSTFVTSTPGFSYWVRPQDPALSSRLYTTKGIDSLGVGTSDIPRTLTIQARPGSVAWLQLKDNTGANKWHFTDFGNGFSISETGVADGRFFIAHGTGNFGMGTMTPGAKLEVNTPTKNALRISNGQGGIDLFTVTGSGDGTTMCGGQTAAACLAAFNNSRSSVGCNDPSATRALCAALGN